MRKFMVLFMSALLMFTLAACGTQGGETDGQAAPPAEEESAETSAAGCLLYTSGKITWPLSVFVVQ